LDNDSGFNKKVSQAIAVFTLLCFVYASSPPLRYVCLKVEQYLRYRLRRIAFELRHMSDPAWKRELMGKTELFVWPQTKPSWWVNMEDADAALPIPPSE